MNKKEYKFHYKNSKQIRKLLKNNKNSNLYKNHKIIHPYPSVTIKQNNKHKIKRSNKVKNNKMSKNN